MRAAATGSAALRGSWTEASTSSWARRPPPQVTRARACRPALQAPPATGAQTGAQPTRLPVRHPPWLPTKPGAASSPTLRDQPALRVGADWQRKRAPCCAAVHVSAMIVALVSKLVQGCFRVHHSGVASCPWGGTGTYAMRACACPRRGWRGSSLVSVEPDPAPHL